MELPKMRTAQGVLDELRTIDPDTQVSLHLIRTIIKSGVVPVVSSGRRELVSFEKVCEFLASGQPLPVQGAGQIRKIS